jgi:hypothetical protein
MINASGQGGQIAFDGQYVTITREGFLGRATHGRGEKRLHVSQISSVQWKPPGLMTNGFIQFTLPGGVERQAPKGSRTLDATKDENSVVFTKKQQPAFEQLRAALEAAMAEQHAPAAPAAASLADELAKLAALRDQGVLSPQEFEQQKARLLGS